MNDGIPLKLWQQLQPTELYQKLPDTLDRWQWIVIATAFLLLAYGHVTGLQRAGNLGRRVTSEWHRTLVVLALVLTSPILARIGIEAMAQWERTESLGALSGVSRRCTRLAFAMPPLESVFVRPDTNSPVPAGYADLTQYADDVWEAGVETGIRDSMTEEPQRTAATHEAGVDAATRTKALAIFLTYVATAASLVGAASLAWLAETLRYVLVVVLASALPVIFAAARVRAFSLKARAAVLIFVWALLCPCVWMVGHLGTEKVFNLYVRFAAMGAADSGRSSELEWAAIDRTSGFDSNRALGFHEFGATASYGWMASLAFCAVLLLAWVAAVTLGGAWLLYRLLASGGRLLESKEADPVFIRSIQAPTAAGVYPEIHSRYPSIKYTNEKTDERKTQAASSRLEAEGEVFWGDDYIEPEGALGPQGTVSYRKVGGPPTDREMEQNAL